MALGFGREREREARERGGKEREELHAPPHTRLYRGGEVKRPPTLTDCSNPQRESREKVCVCVSERERERGGERE